MARCPVCGNITPAGSNCDVANTDCFHITGTGTEADPYVIEVALAGGASQIASCDTEGLRAIVPTTITNPPACMAYHSVDQSITNNTMTTLSLNSELYDTDTMHSTSSNTSRMTFTTAGVYVVTFECAWKKNVTGDRVCQLRKNGVDVLVQDVKKTGGADLVVGHAITLVDNFAAADYIEARVQQNSGAALSILSENYSPFMTATRRA